jgi:putative endonuclease
MARRAEPVRPQKAPRRLIGPGSVTPEPVGSGKVTGRQEPRQEPRQAPRKERVAAFRLGLSAESRAAMLLVAKAYRIVGRRFRAPGGEIDIVARRRRDLVFVEVKARDDLDAAAEAVTERGKRRIVAAAEYWLASHPQDAECFIRFDVILVAPGKLPRHIVNAFDATP